MTALAFPQMAIIGIGVCTSAEGLDVRPLLKRRKDLKLLPDAARLAIPAAKRALGDHDATEAGLFLGVGREPPEDATEAAIVASMVDGALDVGQLGAVGLPLYPPLASLRTLPNLVLAHVAIQVGIRGPGSTRAGDGAASLMAVEEAVWALAEGRCEQALCGGADSLIHPAQGRDLKRRRMVGRPAGAAAVLHLSTAGWVRRNRAPVLAWVTRIETGLAPPQISSVPHHASVGRCGAADGALALARALAAQPSGQLRIHDETGARGEVCWTAPKPEPRS